VIDKINNLFKKFTRKAVIITLNISVTFILILRLASLFMFFTYLSHAENFNIKKQFIKNL